MKAIYPDFQGQYTPLLFLLFCLIAPRLLPRLTVLTDLENQRLSRAVMLALAARRDAKIGDGVWSLNVEPLNFELP